LVIGSPDPEKAEEDPGVEVEKMDSRAGEDKEGSSSGLHIGEPRTGRRIGLHCILGEKMDRVTSVSSSGVGSISMSVLVLAPEPDSAVGSGGVMELVDRRVRAVSSSMTSGVLTLEVLALMELTRVASDERVVKTGIANGVWNRPTRDRGGSAVGNPDGRTGDRPVEGV
jgi:hypothetical protein